MQVIDSAVRSQGVVAQPEVWVVAVFAELQRQTHGCLIDELCQVAHDPGHQQHMSILDGTDIYEDQVWAVIGWRGCNKLQFAIAWQAGFILEQHFLLKGFLEVELLRIPGLADLQGINPGYDYHNAQNGHMLQQRSQLSIILVPCPSYACIA